MFLHAYILWGSTVFYEKHVILPMSYQDIADNCHEYNIAGFPGCIGSQDATHVGMLRCQYRLKTISRFI